MGTKLIQWNCRGVRVNGHWLRSAFFADSHILCLQETFLDQHATLSLPHMHSYVANRNTSRGGGLLTAVHSSIPSHRLLLPPDSSGTVEALGIKIHLHGTWITLINLYLPRGTFVEAWFDALCATVSPPFILLGDFNINLLHTQPPFTPDLQRFHSWALTHNVCICNTTTPTRSVPGHPPSLLDLTIVSPSLHNNLTISVHPDPFDSDHQPVLILLGTSRTQHLSSSQHRTAVNWNLASHFLNGLLDASQDTDLPFQSFQDSCHIAVTQSAYTPKYPSHPNRPWWDSTCRKLLGLKRRYLRLARTLCSQDYWRSYKRTASQLRRYIKQVSRQYWDSVCSAAGSNGTVFKILKSLARKSQPLGDNVLWNGDPLACRLQQANLFLTAFSQHDSLQPLPYDLSDGDPDLDAPFTLQELHLAIRRTRPTSPGTDGVSIKLFRRLSSSNLNRLLTLYNTLFDSGSVPPSWKEATIVPICKPGKPAHLASSYRPIALTPVGAKIFERILLHRLTLWAGRKNIFNPAHFGFMPFKDCTAALCKLYDDLSHARKSRLSAFAACLDLQSAYDSVWIDGLISKLANLGIRGKFGRWIANFLTDRSIRVRWKSVFSSLGPCRRGVPQGCVLSPLLFMIFLFDIFDILDTGVYLLLYADDIFLYAIGHDPERTLRKLQDCLNRLIQWCGALHLTISPEKSLAIDFSRHRSMDAHITVLGCALDWSKVVQILGVWFGRSLTFSHHFAYLRAKAFKRLNYLRSIVSCSRGVHSNHMIRIVNSLVRSLLDYACPLFLHSSPTSLQTLEVIYNSALRVATGLPKCTPIPILRREAMASSMVSRTRYLSHKFLVRQSAIPHSPWSHPTAVSLCSHSSGCLSAAIEELFSLYLVDPRHLIQFSWPTPGYLSPPFQIVVDGLPFHMPSLPPSATSQAWFAWRSSIPSCAILASDASKDSAKTAVAIYNATEDASSAFLLNHLNSVFTAEAIALYLAISQYVRAGGTYILLSDSLSALRALQSVNIRSPRVILMVHNLICRLLADANTSLILIWCPGHAGIPPNERVDALARQGPYQMQPIRWIAPEDLLTVLQNDYVTEKEYSWTESDYFPDYPHLHPTTDFHRWTCSRQADVWISRWRTKMWLTKHRLHRMNLTPSPLCPVCCVPETPDHVLLLCGRFDSNRASLLLSLGLTHQASYSDIMSKAVLSRNGVNALTRFSLAVHRHL